MVARRLFAKAGVSCFYVSEVLNSSIVHLMKFTKKNLHCAKPQTVVYKCLINYL